MDYTIAPHLLLGGHAQIINQTDDTITYTLGKGKLLITLLLDQSSGKIRCASVSPRLPKS